jgi:hypothetical protein
MSAPVSIMVDIRTSALTNFLREFKGITASFSQQVL